MAQTHIATLLSVANSTTQNFGDLVVPGDGLLVVIVMGRYTSTGAVNSLTIGGVNGTVVLSPVVSLHPARIASRSVTGGTYDITATFNWPVFHSAAACWLITGHASDTAVDAAAADSAAATSRSLVLDYPGGGGWGIYLAAHRSPGDIGWSAASEQSDDAVESAWQVAGAQRHASGAGVSETASWSPSDACRIVGAVWEPASAPSGRLKPYGNGFGAGLRRNTFNGGFRRGI